MKFNEIKCNSSDSDVFEDKKEALKKDFFKPEKINFVIPKPEGLSSALYSNKKQQKLFNEKKQNKSEGNVASNFFSKQFIEQKPRDEQLFLNNKRIYLYKTELCRSYSELGYCKYGEKCQFSHSPIELRGINRHPKYKTETCRVFWEQGTCPYGKRCCFLHSNINLDIDEPFEPKKHTLVSLNKSFEINSVADEQNYNTDNMFSVRDLRNTAQYLNFSDKQKLKTKLGKVTKMTDESEKFVFDFTSIELTFEDDLKFAFFKKETKPFIDDFFQIPDLSKKIQKQHFFTKKTSKNADSIWL